jgi:hypothetical protein
MSRVSRVTPAASARISSSMEMLMEKPMELERARMQVESPRPPSAVRSPLLPAFALAEHLDALAGLVDRVSDVDYVVQPAPRATSPIGVQVRQCVDFVLALIERPADEVMTYDVRPGCRSERDRRRAIEHNRRLAMATLRGLAARVRQMAPRTSDVPITVDTPLDRLGARARIRSSLGRELIFVLQQVSATERVTEARCAS